MKNITTITVPITNNELAALRKMIGKSISETDKLSINDSLSATQRAEYRTVQIHKNVENKESHRDKNRREKMPR